MIAVPYWGWIYEPLDPPGDPCGADRRPDRRAVVGRARTPLAPGSRRCCAALGVFHVAAGMLYALLGQLLTFIAEDLGNGIQRPAGRRPRRSRASASCVTVVVTLLADRVGRRRIAHRSSFAALRCSPC